MPITLPTVKSGYNLGLINDNFQTIEAAWDEKLDRLVSTQGNFMEQTLDMNSNDIINTKVSDDPTSLVTKEYVDALFNAIDGAEGVVPLIENRQQGDGVTTLFNSPATEQAPAASFFIQIDGITQRPITDFDATSGGNIQFTEAPPLFSDVDITWFEPAVIGEGDVSNKFVTATDTTEARTLADRFADVVNVRDFGAIGDGVVDDTAAIQAAIDLSQGIVFLPEGTYRVELLTIVDKEVHLKGDNATITKNVGSPDKTLLVVSADNVKVSGITFIIRDNQYSGIYMQKANYCNIVDCAFIGQGSNTTSANGAYGIHCVGFEDGVVTGNWVWDLSRFGDTSHNNFTNCYFTDVGFGVRLQTEGFSTAGSCFSSTVDNCLFEKTWFESIECFFSNKNIITNNRCYNVYNGGIDCDKGSSFNTIANNIIDGIFYSIDPNHPEQQRYAGIKVSGADAATNGGGITRISVDNTITGNVVKSGDNSGFSGPNPYGGIVLQISETTTVDGNVVSLGDKSVGSDGIKIVGRCYNSVISDNTISRCYNGIATQAQKFNDYTWEEYDMNGVIIKDNSISEFEEHGIYASFLNNTQDYLDSRKYFRVQGNTIQFGNTGCNVSIQVTGTYMVVQDNMVTNNPSQRAFRVNGLDCILKDNFTAECAGTYSWVFDPLFTPVRVLGDVVLNGTTNEEPVLDKFWKPQATNNKIIIYADEIPTSGYFRVGDVIRNNTPGTGEDAEWVCIATGYAAPGASWDAGTTYQQGDTIAQSGIVYLSLISNNTNLPPNTNPNAWKPLGNPWGYRKTGTVGT